MKFFAALKTADFAAKLSAAAGFDLEAAMKSGNENALKEYVAAAVAAGVASAPKPEAALTEEVRTLTNALESAQSENATITGTLNSVGFVFPAHDATATSEQQIEANKAALESHIKVRAQGILAQTGHPAIADIKADATDDTQKNLTGRERYTADFNRQFAARARN